MTRTPTVWTPQSPATGATPCIGHQFVGMGRQVLGLRRPYLDVSVLMAQMYMVTIMGLVYLIFGQIWNSHSLLREFGLQKIWQAYFPDICFIGFIGLLLTMHLRHLKRSHIFFNRHTQHVYNKEGNYLWEGDWQGAQASPVSFVDATNVGATVRHSLNMLVPKIGPMPPHRFWQKRLPPGTFQVRIMSNEETDPRTDYVAQVWEYVRTFMAEGPDNLPIPTEPNWWLLPYHRVVLSPSEAWRHYVPWRTGELGERQGKKNWLLPLWAVLFPLTLSVSLCWWLLCTVLRIHAPVTPPEALAGEAGPLVTVDMASNGMRP